MPPWLYNLPLTIAQMAFDPPPASPPLHPAPAPHRLSFSDFQQGLRASDNGNPDDRHFQLMLLALLAVVGLIALILHLRQRQKTAGPLNSTRRLAWELSRNIHFPFGTRLLLLWVAAHAQTPVATLLISVRSFDRAVETWAALPTFALIRQWGRTRLLSLKPTLFAPNS